MGNSRLVFLIGEVMALLGLRGSGPADTRPGRRRE
jgi:hypothetical protein